MSPADEPYTRDEAWRILCSGIAIGLFLALVIDVIGAVIA